MVSKSKYADIVKGKEQLIVDSYLQGYGIINIAKEYRVTEDTIRKVLLKQNVRLRTRSEARNSPIGSTAFKRSKTKIQDRQLIEEIIAQYYSGKGCAELSEIYNIPTTSIRLILKREGVTFRNEKEAQSHPHTKARLKQKTLEKYGVESIMHLPEMYERQQRAMHKFHTHEIDNVLFKNLQGYESIGIQYILHNFNISASDIIAGRIEIIPKIQYAFNGTQKLYFPDIFIPSLNLIVEIKSEYILNLELDKNMAKQAACKAAGYDHKILIFDQKQNFVKEI